MKKSIILSMLFFLSATCWAGAVSVQDCLKYYPTTKEGAFRLSTDNGYQGPGKDPDLDRMCRSGCQYSHDKFCMPYSHLDKCCRDALQRCNDLCHF